MAATSATNELERVAETSLTKDQMAERAFEQDKLALELAAAKKAVADKLAEMVASEKLWSEREATAKVRDEKEVPPTTAIYVSTNESESKEDEMESEVETPSTMIPTALDEDAVSHDSELANQAHFECLKTLDAVHDVFQQVLDGLELAKHMIPYAAHDIFAMVDMLLTEVASFCCNQLLPKMFRFKDLFCSITEFLNSYMTEKWLPAIEHAYMDQTKAAHSMNVIMFWDRVVRVTAKEAGMERDVSSAFLRKALRDASVRTTGGGSKDGVAMRR